ncbi:DegV family protein [Metabacillus iocasae]|uniref:DegV family protein with EDD domain n=1 Tax=Priestia iocasae TaxID=2291674 RepID=A0ABS2QY86_9BACI|nr:DegV family protein [Metabacillus iocasae]MBM7704458.1 DegV family protein with EDD domain [Metabacillus iocasae]
MKTAIITDSTAYIDQTILHKLNIHMVPLSVIFGNETYREEMDITAEQFYEKVREAETLPTTSQPPIGQFVELFEQLKEEYDAAIVVTLSSGISGTYQGAITAGSMVDGIDVHVYDSEISCMIQGFYVLEAAQMANEGKGSDEILARLEEMKKSISAYFMVDDLSHLQRGGRLSATQAFVGSLLQVKPLLHFVDKKIVPFEKIRTRKKAIKRIVEVLDQEAAHNEPMKAVVIHANRQEEAAELKAELEKEYPQIEWGISHFGPVIGTHLGEGSMGIGWYKI